MPIVVLVGPPPASPFPARARLSNRLTAVTLDNAFRHRVEDLTGRGAPSAASEPSSCSATRAAAAVAFAKSTWVLASAIIFIFSGSPCRSTVNVHGSWPFMMLTTASFPTVVESASASNTGIRRWRALPISLMCTPTIVKLFWHKTGLLLSWHCSKNLVAAGETMPPSSPPTALPGDMMTTGILRRCFSPESSALVPTGGCLSVKARMMQAGGREDFAIFAAFPSATDSALGSCVSERLSEGFATVCGASVAIMTTAFPCMSSVVTTPSPSSYRTTDILPFSVWKSYTHSSKGCEIAERVHSAALIQKNSGGGFTSIDAGGLRFDSSSPFLPPPTSIWSPSASSTNSCKSSSSSSSSSKYTPSSGSLNAIEVNAVRRLSLLVLVLVQLFRMKESSFLAAFLTTSISGETSTTALAPASAALTAMLDAYVASRYLVGVFSSPLPNASNAIFDLTTLPPSCSLAAAPISLKVTLASSTVTCKISSPVNAGHAHELKDAAATGCNGVPL